MKSKRKLDPWEPIAHLWEEEREPDSTLLPAFTVFLAGAECPFSCVFCDLWRETLDGPTPAGALPIQLRKALAAAGPLPRPAALKLYNASNFFEPRAVPETDEDELIELASPFSRVTVECHPRLIGDRCLRFAERLSGSLEVAMGLETIHPEALPRLNKGMTLADFDRAAETLRRAGIGLRAFVLVGAPFVPAEGAVEWAVRSALHAFAQGAARVSLIPLRGSNTPPRLDQLEEALERCLEPFQPFAKGLPGTAGIPAGQTNFVFDEKAGKDAGGPRGATQGIVTADLWDARHFAICSSCADARIARLDRMNRTGRKEPRIACGDCGTS